MFRRPGAPWTTLCTCFASSTSRRFPQTTHSYVPWLKNIPGPRDRHLRQFPYPAAPPGKRHSTHWNAGRMVKLRRLEASNCRAERRTRERRGGSGRQILLHLVRRGARGVRSSDRHDHRRSIGQAERPDLVRERRGASPLRDAESGSSQALVSSAAATPPTRKGGAWRRAMLTRGLRIRECRSRGLQ
jgi:hypothetical protein